MSDCRKCINMQDNIKIQIIKSRRKTIGLEVHTDGQVIVRAPLRISSRELDKFINEHINWIESKIKLMEERSYKKIPTGAPSIDSITDEEWLSIKDVFVGRVKYYCNIMGVNVSRITIRNQKTRWGSCSAKGNVNFNYQLYYMPEELMDYVIVHELSHRRYMNHSSLFWKEVEKYCPEYKRCRQRLKQYELTL